MMANIDERLIHPLRDLFQSVSIKEMKLDRPKLVG
jgi:hypothetical protein